MPYSPVERDRIIDAICPHCAKGNKPRYRTDSGEWVHDLGWTSQDEKTTFVKHTICFANHFRKGELSGEVDGR